MSLKDNVAHGVEPTADLRTLTDRERSSSLQGKDLKVKAEAVPQNTEKRILDLLTGLASGWLS